MKTRFRRVAPVHVFLVALFGSLLTVGTSVPAQAVSQKVTPVVGISLLNSDGVLQSSFAQGTGFTSGANSGGVFDLARQPNGDIVLVGSFTAYNGTTGLGYITRLRPDGSIDASFVAASNGGFSLAGTGPRGVALQPDGKILVTGRFDSYGGVSLAGFQRVIRLNADGSLDTTFTAPGVTSGAGKNVIFDDLAYQANNAVQRFYVQTNYDVYRVDATTGALDTSFGDAGRVADLVGDGASKFDSLAQRPDGKLLAGGVNGNGITRYNVDGTIDTSFGTAGTVKISKIYPRDSQGSIHDMALTPDGKIVVGGEFAVVAGTSGFDNLVRLNSDGTIDASFSSRPLFNHNVLTVFAQPDGKIVAGGMFDSVSVGGASGTYGGIIRLNADGTVDTTGYNSGAGYRGDPYSLISDGNGGLWVGGFYSSFDGASDRASIASFDPNGGLGSMSPISGNTVTAPACGFGARTAMLEFAFWSTTSDGSGTRYDVGDTITLSADTTLYAQWRAAGSGPTPPAPPAWTAPVDVSSPLGNAEGAQVVVDSDGRATVVWDRNNGDNYIVQSSTSLDGGEWVAPDDLSATGANAVVPQVSVNADGTAVAVWSRSNGSNTIIQSSTSINGGEWSTPVDDLSEVGGDAFYPQVTVDAIGTAIAVWSRSNGTNTIIQASTRPSGGSWSTPVDLSAPGEDATNPQVTVDADGTAIAVWTRSNGTNDIVQASTRPSGGSWTTPADNLSEAGQDASAPQVSVDANGTATAVWIRSNGTNDIVQSSTRPRGGPWSTPVANLSEAGEDAGTPQVAVDANGTAIAVWNRSDGSNTIVQASSRPSGGSWTTPEDLSEPLGNAFQQQVTVDANGAATVVWNRYDGSNFIIQSSRSTDGVTWDTPVDLSDPLQDALAPQVTVGPSGLVTAVWERSNGTNTIIQSSSLVTAASPEAGSGGAALADTGLTSWSAVLVVVAAATLFILAYGTCFARSQLRLAGDNNKLHSLLRRAGLRD
jgi:uncharacterized delta-60 repeat protein